MEAIVSFRKTAFTIGSAVLLACTVGSATAMAAPIASDPGAMVNKVVTAPAGESTKLVDQVRKCTYGLLFDANRLTCDLAIIVNPK
jgi:hypothetical protein